MLTKIKTTEEIAAMRESGKMLATVLGTLKQQFQVGMTTKDLAEIAARELQALGGKPTFLGMYGFPDVLCVSVNDEVVHGIPSEKRVIKDGDIVSMDFGVTYRGMITDSAITAIAGRTASDRVKELVATTEESLHQGLAILKHGTRVGDLANAIQEVLDGAKLGIVRDLVGHGVGHELHEDPNIPNFGRKGTGIELQKGMTIAIEPMATLGDFRVYIDTDGWTVRTNDRSLAAHFEHTVLITEDGAEILTKI
jgi:methionyl aminopeptidase